MVMEGHEFESQHLIHFSTFNCCKNCSVFEKMKINEKEAGVCPFFEEKNFCTQPSVLFKIRPLHDFCPSVSVILRGSNYPRGRHQQVDISCLMQIVIRPK